MDNNQNPINKNKIMMKTYVKKNNVSTPIDKRKRLKVGYKCNIMKDEIWNYKLINYRVKPSDIINSGQYLEGHFFELERIKITNNTDFDDLTYYFDCSGYTEEYYYNNNFKYTLVWNKNKNIFYMIDRCAYGFALTNTIYDREDDGRPIIGDDFLPFIFKNPPKYCCDLTQY
tara:strand:+ start:425 stop:940 length:516 start_codon:yes stop_codon:yes gene_type:complete